MYGLVQSVIITQYTLKERLIPYGYAPAKITQGIWNHKCRDINFTLVVDDFGIKYNKKQDADHLIT